MIASFSFKLSAFWKSRFFIKRDKLRDDYLSSIKFEYINFVYQGMMAFANYSLMKDQYTIMNIFIKFFPQYKEELLQSPMLRSRILKADIQCAHIAMTIAHISVMIILLTVIKKRRKGGPSMAMRTLQFTLFVIYIMCYVLLGQHYFAWLGIQFESKSTLFLTIEVYSVIPIMIYAKVMCYVYLQKMFKCAEKKISNIRELVNDYQQRNNQGGMNTITSILFGSIKK